jgi:hypothetical protein
LYIYAFYRRVLKGDLDLFRDIFIHLLTSTKTIRNFLFLYDLGAVVKQFDLNFYVTFFDVLKNGFNFLPSISAEEFYSTSTSPYHKIDVALEIVTLFINKHNELIRKKKLAKSSTSTGLLNRTDTKESFIFDSTNDYSTLPTNFSQLSSSPSAVISLYTPSESTSSSTSSSVLSPPSFTSSALSNTINTFSSSPTLPSFSPPFENIVTLSSSSSSSTLNSVNIFSNNNDLNNKVNGDDSNGDNRNGIVQRNSGVANSLSSDLISNSKKTVTFNTPPSKSNEYNNHPSNYYNSNYSPSPKSPHSPRSPTSPHPAMNVGCSSSSMSSSYSPTNTYHSLNPVLTDTFASLSDQFSYTSAVSSFDMTIRSFNVVYFVFFKLKY